MPDRPARAIFAAMSKLFKALTPKPAKPRAGSAERPQTGGVDRDTLDRAARDKAGGPSPGTTASEAGKAKEIGGPDGREPTRYGDWERGGICYDF